jgi:hypothetical protein
MDESEFGGEGCGSGRDLPCRTLTLALAEALSDYAIDQPIRFAAAEMKLRAARALAQE